MAHIAFRVPRFHTNMVGWVEQLEAFGHSVSLLVSRSEPTEIHHTGVLRATSLFEIPNREDSPQGPNSSAPRVALSRWLSETKPDLLIVRDFNRVYSQTALAAGRRFNIRTVLYLQVQDLKDLHPVHAQAVEWFSRVTSTRLISPLPPAANPASSSSLTFTPFVPGAEFFTSASESSETIGQLRMLSVGKFVERKRHDLAVECLKSSSPSDATLTIVGERSTAEHEAQWSLLIEQVGYEGLGERITFRANVTPESMPALFREHDLLLMLAEREPASMSVVEALASGLVVVARSDNRTSAFVAASGLGVVLPLSGSEGLAQAIEDATEILRSTSRMERQSRFIRLFGPTVAMAAWNDLLTDR